MGGGTYAESEFADLACETRTPLLLFMERISVEINFHRTDSVASPLRLSCCLVRDKAECN